MWLILYGIAGYWIYREDPDYDAEGEQQWSEFCEKTRMLESQMGRRPRLPKRWRR